MAEHCSTIGKDETVDLTLMSSIETVFRSLACLNGSFLKTDRDSQMGCTSKNPGINMSDAASAFNHIAKMENLALKQVVCINQ